MGKFQVRLEIAHSRTFTRDGFPLITNGKPPRLAFGCCAALLPLVMQGAARRAPKVSVWSKPPVGGAPRPKIPPVEQSQRGTGKGDGTGNGDDWKWGQTPFPTGAAAEVPISCLSPLQRLRNGKPGVYLGRGRDVACATPPAQIRTSGITAYGSYLG
jgi:hypothetical protein